MFTDDHGLLSVPDGSPLRTHLAVETVGVGAATQTLDLPAAVEADPARVANVVTPLTGRVVALKVTLGDHVRRGQVLALLRSGDFAQALSDAAKARDALDLADKALSRARGVRDAGGSAVKDLEAAQSADNQAQAENIRAQARLSALNGQAGAGGELALTAPQDGVVTALNVASGAQVTDPTAVLMTVSNLDRVYVTANVAEDQIGQIVIGEAAEITLSGLGGPTLHGKVSEVDAIVAPDTRRQKVRIALANPGGKLLPNQYATVHVSLPTARAVHAPQSALLMNNDTTSVLVEVRPWVFERRAVRIGDETATSVDVISGLNPGDRIVVRGGVLLND
jgi:cobalt-zinc-cadmium efflux system membrane fusion protein